MGDFTNDLNWSASRDRALNDCKRMYHNLYYGSWGGWAADAPKRARALYKLKNLTAYYMWRGDLLHRAAEKYLNDAYIGACKKREAYFTFIEETAVAEWEGSEACENLSPEDLPNTKYTPVMVEHILGTMEFDLEDTISEIKTWFMRFTQLDIVKQVAKDPSLIHSIEAMVQNKHEGVGTFLKMDLVVYDGPKRDRLAIYDWKTGRPRQVDKEQLAFYYAYWNAEGYAPEHITLYDVYLKMPPQNAVKELPCESCKHFETAIRALKESVTRMKELLVRKDAKANKPKPLSHFPKVNTSCKGICNSCKFRFDCWD